MEMSPSIKRAALADTTLSQDELHAIADKVEECANSLSSREMKTIVFENAVLSPDELILEIRTGTDIGRKFAALFNQIQELRREKRGVIGNTIQ